MVPQVVQGDSRPHLKTTRGQYPSQIHYLDNKGTPTPSSTSSCTTSTSSASVDTDRCTLQVSPSQLWAIVPVSILEEYMWKALFSFHPLVA
ncbi:hypothetical protein E2C01_029542 [Portunus trituberculatus]|uniref:Uncharacterized protein n=1 Tax=Portunus trituberculatus TaxID=210409 RepID=A0A5B7EUV5_PORTR|nr:hypothetical protein [Portunus trituberculatus]